jgi:hypothetical protein
VVGSFDDIAYELRSQVGGDAEIGTRQRLDLNRESASLFPYHVVKIGRACESNHLPEAYAAASE